VRKLVYGHLSKDSVAAAFKQWGGIPRILLDYGNKPEKLSELHDSIYPSDPFVLFHQAGLSRIDHANVSGLHFHLIPGQKPDSIQTPADDTSFRYPAYCWATTWLQERFWQVLKNEQGELNMLRFLLDQNNVSTARAFAFEPHVFRTIETSGFSGRLRLLTDNGGEERGPKRMGPWIRRSFATFEELPSGEGAHDGMFYVPIQTNYTSVDFYVPSMGLLVQVTVGQKHGVKRAGLEAAEKSGMFSEWREDNPDEKLRLVFLCDGFNFDQFTKQPYLTSKGVTIKSQSVLKKLNDNFEQYAWELDVDIQLQFHQKPGKKSTGKLAAADSWDDKIKLLDHGKGKGKGKAVDTSSSLAGPSQPTTSTKKRGIEEVD
jgi:hypothetical protein